MIAKLVVVSILLSLAQFCLVLTEETELPLVKENAMNEPSGPENTAAQDETQAQKVKGQQTQINILPPGTKPKKGHGSKISLEFVAGDTGSCGGGATYTRWGKTTCPSTEGTSLLYSGRAAGSHYTHRGGASELLCLPNNPQFLASRNGGARSILYQTEYETNSGPSFQNLHNRDVPCATCVTTKRNIKIMIPGRITCLGGWTREYYGYLMADHYGHHRHQYTCVDVHAEGVPGTAKNINGALLYHVEVHTGSLPRAYRNGNEMTCVVCTK